MNHEYFRNCVGQRLRLEPPAIGPEGRTVDDDWGVVAIDVALGAATLRHLTRGSEVVIGFDAVKNYDKDPARGPGHGFLNMLWQVRIAPDGTISARPIPARPAAEQAPQFNPLIVNDGETDRHLTWASRDDALPHLVEGEPRQLFNTFIAVCDALRTTTGREPQFDAPNDIRHEIVWELMPDHRSRRKLLGGTAGRQGTAVLVLTNNRAQARPEGVVNAAPPEIASVDQDYPSRSGLQDRLAAEGFGVHWVREERVGRRQAEGWEVVITEEDGRRAMFQIAPGMPAVDPAALILMKRRA
jgi:hypothetical protein